MIVFVLFGFLKSNLYICFCFSAFFKPTLKKCPQTRVAMFGSNQLLLSAGWRGEPGNPKQWVPQKEYPLMMDSWVACKKCRGT